MNCLTNIIKEGWPREKKNIAHEIREYFGCRDELNVQDNVIYRGERVIIPRSMRNETLQKLHLGHFGIVGTLQRAR